MKTKWIAIILLLSMTFTSFDFFMIKNAEAADNAKIMLRPSNFSKSGFWTMSVEDYAFRKGSGPDYNTAVGKGYALKGAGALPYSPAEQEIFVPSDGQYKVWIRTRNAGYPTDRGIKISLNGAVIKDSYGDDFSAGTGPHTNTLNFFWEQSEIVNLSAGKVNISIEQMNVMPRFDTLIVTNDLSYTPAGTGYIYPAELLSYEDYDAPAWAEGISLTATDITETGMTLNWGPGTDNKGIEAYDIYKDNELIATLDKTVTTYQIDGLQAVTTYTIKVVGRDAAGNSSTALTLEQATAGEGLSAVPQIITGPESKEIKEGESVTFSVYATVFDGGTLTYQWKKDGEDIGGAVSESYSINNVQESDAGNYTVEITNTRGDLLPGSTTSNVASLVVLPLHPVVKVDDYGAIPDDMLNDGDAVRSAISAAISKGPGATVYFSPGKYRINPASTADKFSINYNNVKGLNLIGENTEILFTDSFTGGFNFSNSSDIAFKGLTIDYEVLPWAQGSVTAVDDANGTFDYQAEDGYTVLNDPRTSKTNSFGMVRDPENPAMLSKKAKDDYFSFDSVEKLSDNTYRIKIGSSFRDWIGTANNIEIGAKVILNNRGSAVSAFNFLNTPTNITIENCTVYASGGSVIIAANSKGYFNISNFKVLRKPDSGRWISTNADGIHIQSSKGGVTVKDSIFEGLSDDIIALYQKANTISEVYSDTKILLVNGTAIEIPAPGDTLQVLDAVSGKIRGTSKVIGVEAVAGFSPSQRAILTLDSPIPGMVSGANFRTSDQVYNLSANFPDTVISGNVFRESRRYGIMLRAVNATIENNLFKDLQGPALDIINKPAYPSGPAGVENLKIINNVIDNIAQLDKWVQLKEYIAPINVRGETLSYGLSEGYLHKQVLIKDNVIKHSLRNGISIGGAENIQIIGNKIEAVPFEGITDNNIAGIKLENVKDVVIDGVELDDMRADLKAGIEIADNCVNVNVGSLQFSITKGVPYILGNYHSLVSATPVITTQPASQEVEEGDSVTFSVNAEVYDEGMLSYQWKKDGINIPNATSATYTINPAAKSNAGSYSVEVTNTKGDCAPVAASSDTALLTVKDSEPTVSVDGKLVTASIKTVAIADPETGTAVARVDSGTLLRLVDKVKESETNGQRAVAELKIMTGSEAAGVYAELPREAISRLLAETKADFRFNVGFGTITMSAKMLEKINRVSAEGDIRIGMTRVNTSSLEPEDQASVADNPVFAFPVKVGNVEISNLLGGTADLSISWLTAAEEQKNSIIVYYIDTDGELQTVKGKYNEETGTVNFKVDHR